MSDDTPRVRADAIRGALVQLEGELAARGQGKLQRYFPSTGAYRRALYPKQLEFFAAGAKHRERAFIAGNRTGKTVGGAYEATLHLLGEYPDWWEGRRFSEPVRAWAAGDTSSTARDILQLALLGPRGEYGTGFIPAHRIEHTRSKSGVPDAVETIWVRHASGGVSSCQFRSYDQRREAFQGTSMHMIWLDEEPDSDIYHECLLRTAKTSDFPGGIVYLTFTPLKGMTPLVRSFLQDAANRQ